MGCGARRGNINSKGGQDFQSGFEETSGLVFNTEPMNSTGGLWRTMFRGGGSGVWVGAASGRSQVLYQSPTKASGANPTFSSLTLTNGWFTNFDMTFDVNTISQNRLNVAANNWERAWVMWHYYDSFHHYYFTMKNDGCEWGKKDNFLNAEEQIFLATPGAPDIPLDSWYTVRIRSVDNFTSIWVSGALVVSGIDNGVSGATAPMYQGAIGLYNEDSFVAFDNVVINSV